MKNRFKITLAIIGLLSILGIALLNFVVAMEPQVHQVFSQAQISAPYRNFTNRYRGGGTILTVLTQKGEEFRVSTYGHPKNTAIGTVLCIEIVSGKFSNKRNANLTLPRNCARFSTN